jgi:hypothetical protein
MKRLRKGVCAALLAVVLATGTNGCSTFYHYERVGMPKSERGDVDVGMIIINLFSNLGLGIIVDAITGSMWCPKTKW